MLVQPKDVMSFSRQSVQLIIRQMANLTAVLTKLGRLQALHSTCTVHRLYTSSSLLPAWRLDAQPADCARELLCGLHVSL